MRAGLLALLGAAVPFRLRNCRARLAASQLHANQKSNGALPPHESFEDQLH